MAAPTAPAALSPAALGEAFRAAERWLDANRERLNAINVYPVPDGDTGTNMLLTLRAALEAAERPPATDSAAWLRQLARGALLGARGNSGVILSQWLRGLSEALPEGTAAVAAPALAAALEQAAW
ncbi:MAG: DAK2 domain-containing protein, partial [Chloroflexi bacterium]|nr:DAK2 domain-containing protein [Chloroflexota bacterium]